MRKVFHLLILNIIFFSTVSFAAPPPDEVEKLKGDAELQIIGKVIEDKLNESNDDKENPTQERIMSIRINQNKKGPLNKNEIVNIAYHYVPRWDVYSYSSATSININKGDIVEVWANKQNEMYSLVLNGHGISLIQENGARIDHISEPLLHKSKRIVSNWWILYSPIVVFLFIIFGLAILLIMSSRSVRH